MCGNNKRACRGCYPKRITDYFDLYAEPVYHFTFRDSYFVSTCVGSCATIALILGLVYVLFSKSLVYVEADPNTFTITEGLEYAYYPIETEFDRHQIAIGLSYKAEYQDQMDKVNEQMFFTDYLQSLVEIEMFM